NAPRERDGLFDIVRWDYAAVQRPVVPAQAGTHDHCRWLWVPALPSLSRGSAGTTTGSVLRTDLRLWETIAGSPCLFPACYLQGTLQPPRVEPSACRYCFGMPARSITAAHLPMSPARRALNSSGVLALASMPSSA